MKKFLITSILTVLIASLTAVSAGNYPEEYLGLPGDNLNLYATMKLFQESETLEAFERDLNDEKSKINNLDLNGDNLVDYITVTDYVDGNAHTIVLRTALNKKESQDVAVFTVEQFKDGSVQIQLVGDEALYGKNYIVEPIYAETPNPGYKGTTVYTDNVNVVTTTYYEVAAWPVIRFMYNPYYVSWHSSWYWGYYPVYWNPWRPYYWHYYYGYHYNWYNDYYAHYRHCDYNRYHYYDDHYYHGMRQYSSEVAHRVSAGNYASTYSHPEQRRDGEEMYARTQAGRSADTRRQSSAQSAPSAQRSSADVVTEIICFRNPEISYCLNTEVSLFRICISTEVRAFKAVFSTEVAVISFKTAGFSPEVAALSFKTAVFSPEVGALSFKTAGFSAEVAALSFKTAGFSTEVAALSFKTAGFSAEVAALSFKTAGFSTEVAALSFKTAGFSTEVAAPEVSSSRSQVIKPQQ